MLVCRSEATTLVYDKHTPNCHFNIFFENFYIFATNLEFVCYNVCIMTEQLSLFKEQIFNLEDIATKTKWQSFRYIDLFAGIGGIRLPFQRLGGTCVFSSEIDKFAIETYKANYNETPHGDITQIREDEIPNFDILLAGFPCQAFSIAGKRKGFEDTRGTLFFDVARILKYHKPRVFLLENVKGLLNHNKGETFKVMIDILENQLNYKIFYKVLNAKDYGVPQNRERVIIVGFLDHSINFKFPEPFENKVIVGDILDKEIPEKYTISDKIWASHQRRKEEHKKKGNGFGYSLFNDKSPYTSTISARYYKDGSEILIEQKNKNPRRLTPREACRLQGFPESFKIVVSDNQAYKQFGNSVPTKMIGAVADEILKALRSKYEE